MTLTEKIAALRRAGFQINYAPYGAWSWSPGNYGTADRWQSWERCPTEVWCADVSEHHAAGLRAYVDLSSVGKSECQAGQSSTLDRSNFRSLIRDYPDTFSPTGYSNVAGLAAYVGNLPAELVDVLAALKNEYPAYDEQDMSELESDEISESFDQYVTRDMRDDFTQDWYLDAWDGMPEDDARHLFWQACQNADYYPEHDGYDVCWNYKEIMPALEELLRPSYSDSPNQLTLI